MWLCTHIAKFVFAHRSYLYELRWNYHRHWCWAFFAKPNLKNLMSPLTISLGLTKTLILGHWIIQEKLLLLESKSVNKQLFFLSKKPFFYVFSKSFQTRIYSVLIQIFLRLHCMKSVQIRSFFLFRIFLCADWIRGFME